MKAFLDLGCGPHKRRGYLGLDLDPWKNLDIIGDAHNLPIRNKVLEQIVSSKVLEHLKNPFNCISECRRVLKNGSELIIGIPNIHTFRRFLRWMVKGKISVGAHIFCWGLPEIINLVESMGFTYSRYFLDTYDRYHSLGFWERLIIKFNRRVVDKNLNVVFMSNVEEWRIYVTHRSYYKQFIKEGSIYQVFLLDGDLFTLCHPMRIIDGF